MSTINVKYAIRYVQDFLPSHIPPLNETIVFNCGFGRLKLWRYADDRVWVGFILPHKHDPTQDNLLHLSPNELVRISKEEVIK